MSMSTGFTSLRSDPSEWAGWPGTCPAWWIPPMTDTCLCSPYSQDGFGPDERRYFAGLPARLWGGVKT